MFLLVCLYIIFEMVIELVNSAFLSGKNKILIN